MKSTTITLIACALLFGLLLGYLLFGPRATKAPTMMMDSMDHSMMHPEISVDTSLPIPTVSLVAHKDTMDGYNIEITTEHFMFAPERVNQAVVPNEGHAHLFINGMKIGRVYSNWLHIGNTQLRNGENVIMVTLNANDHSDWIHDGLHIMDTVTIEK